MAEGFWVQELHRPRLGRGLWQTPANRSRSHERKTTSTRSTSQIHAETDRQTGRPRRARPGERVGWRRQARSEAPRRPKRRAEQVAPRGAEAPGSASAALTVGAPAPRRGAGEAKAGRWGSSGAEVQSPLLTALRARGRGPGSSFRAGVVCPVPRSPRCPPRAHRLRWGAPRGQGSLLLWGAGAEAGRLITKEC